MQPFTLVRGVAAPLPEPNIDTDVIMPKQFLKIVDREGLARGALHDRRFLPDGTPRAEFILNRDPWNRSSFLVVGANFGCGSSREHAVWGLMQLGIRAVIGTSFGGIFYDNAARNGLLVVEVPAVEVSTLMQTVANPEQCIVAVDLVNRCICPESGVLIPFAIEPLRRSALLEGRDHIANTLVHAEAIAAFEAQLEHRSGRGADASCPRRSG